MAAQRIELVQRAYDAWNRGDLPGLLEHTTEDLEFVPGPGFFLEERYDGHDGFRRFWETWLEAWESLTIRTEKIEERGDRVLALLVFDASAGVAAFRSHSTSVTSSGSGTG